MSEINREVIAGEGRLPRGSLLSPLPPCSASKLSLLDQDPARISSEEVCRAHIGKGSRFPRTHRPSGGLM